MKKCKWKLGLALCLAGALAFSNALAAPVTSYAADEVVWNKDENGKETYPNKVVIKPYTYSELPSDIGVNKELDDDDLSKVSAKVIYDWAPIAYYIFKWGSDKGGDKSGVTANWNTGDWEDYFNNGSSSAAEEIDLEEWLRKTNGGEKGSIKDDHSVATGMRHCTSLNALRDDIASEISKALDPEDVHTSDLMEQSGGDDGVLHELSGNSGSPIFYNLVTHINKIGDEKRYFYNSYGIAVYDFQLAPIVDPQLPYKDAVSMPDPNGASGDMKLNSYSENQSDKESEVSMELETETSQEVSNSITKTESYSLTETIGNEFSFGKDISFFKDVLSIEVSATETMETSRTEGKTVVTKANNKVNAGLSLPGHTAVEIIQSTGETNTITNYTCPVALRYKVAIFSMSGYTFWAWPNYYYTGTYSNFSTIFGNGDKQGGYGAPENLYLRAIKSINGDHYDPSDDRAYGKVHGWYHDTSTNNEIVTDIDWKTIRGYSNGRIISYLNNCATNIPLFGQGASLRVTIKGKQTTIGEIFPLYYLKSVKIDEGDSEYEISLGDSIDLDSITVNGYDDGDVPYYGFKPDRGGWILCDENGDEISSSNVAEIVTDSKTGKSELKAKSKGTVYMKWVLDDTIEYLGVKAGKKVSATENVPEYPYIKVKVVDPPADLTQYRIEFKNYEATVLVDEELDLNDALKPSVYDSSDILHTHDVDFYSKDMTDSRLNINASGEFEDGIFKATEPGEYKVFAKYSNYGNTLQSEDFPTIKVLPQRELEYLAVTNPEDEKITNTVTSCSYDLPTYVKYMDNYDEEWTGDKPALSFKLPDEISDEDAVIDANGQLTVYKGGKYKVTVSAEGLADVTMEVKVNALGELTVSDDADPAVLEPFIFNDGDNTVDLSGLTITGKGLDGNDWDVENDSDITWYADGTECPNGIFTATEDNKIYKIWAQSGDIKSNELELEVKEERKLAELILSGDIEDEKVGLGIGDGYTIDLSPAGLQNSTDVVVKGIDQYDHEYDLSNTALKWTADEHYAQIKNDTTLFGKVKGTGTLYVSTDDDSIQSNTIDFNVWLKPYVKEIYADKGGTFREDDVIDLSQILVSAKDQEGEVYNLSDEEKASIEWTLTDKGSIKASKSTHIDFDQQAKTLTITEGEISYGKTGSITLAASFVNPNGIKVEGNTTINIMQKPILHELKLSLKNQDDAVLPTEVTYYASDLFDYDGIDQYSDPYDLTNEILTFKSSNADYVVDEADDKDNCTILTGPSGSSTDITVTNTNYINKDVVSNKVTISTPEVRRMKTLEFTYVPEALKFGENLDLLTLGATCFDEKHKAFTEKEVEDYPSYITYSYDKGETNSDIDTAKNIVTAGDNKRAYITVSAFAVNGTTNKELTDASGNIIQTSDQIWVGPMIKEIKASDTVFHVKGGKVKITFNGLALENGIEVKLLDKSGKEVQTATSTGTEKSQTVEFTLADNKSLTEPVQYTITYTVCGDPEGSDEFAPKSDIKLVVENHKLRKIERKEATCEEDGNIEYWICDTCKKLFKDEKATEEIKLEDTVLKAPGHVWDEGVITKEATVDEEGEKTFTCQTCKETRIEAVPKLKQTSGTMLCMLKSKGKTSLELTWSEIKGADGYDVFFGRCNHNGKSSSAELVATVEPGQQLKYTAKGLKKGKEYKAYVQAFIYGNEKKIYVTDCELVHAYTGNYTKGYTNPKSISVNKSKVKLKVGKTFNIKAKVNKVKKGKKLMPSGHAPSLRYVSTDPSIAKVGKKGKITAVSKGKCTIYVYGVNGVRKAVNVTVK